MVAFDFNTATLFIYMKPKYKYIGISAIRIMHISMPMNLIA